MNSKLTKNLENFEFIFEFKIARNFEFIFEIFVNFEVFFCIYQILSIADEVTINTYCDNSKQ